MAQRHYLIWLPGTHAKYAIQGPDQVIYYKPGPEWVVKLHD